MGEWDEEKRAEREAHQRADMIAHFKQICTEFICVEAEARAVAEVAISPDRLPATYRYVSARERAVGLEARMVLSKEAIEVPVG